MSKQLTVEERQHIRKRFTTYTKYNMPIFDAQVERVLGAEFSAWKEVERLKKVIKGTIDELEAIITHTDSFYIEDIARAAILDIENALEGME
ncbi:hypothetical protein M5X02_23950 [Paenibacillus alvei]|uniref:hypothetical protein n=1 Tax=Paenibacillus alvei TaxID=44250 RepID=UPI000289DD6B|nr:hypothetical protein [Paenibacillus alvei]EJW14828.1 hypothetical protein PAV_11c01690 [Paenibacillus alvei DSM 29]MCY9543694.1 hypothetical protein [Paenibacillus alvei]MCY9708532.1 hypothetical protein [Paenibacillus alvei]MEC0083233.1 hypothetical protein [Paenibacillus alvei]